MAWQKPCLVCARGSGDRQKRPPGPGARSLLRQIWEPHGEQVREQLVQDPLGKTPLTHNRGRTRLREVRDPSMSVGSKSQLDPACTVSEIVGVAVAVAESGPRVEHQRPP